MRFVFAIIGGAAGGIAVRDTHSIALGIVLLVLVARIIYRDFIEAH